MSRGRRSACRGRPSPRRRSAGRVVMRGLAVMAMVLVLSVATGRTPSAPARAQGPSGALAGPHVALMTVEVAEPGPVEVQVPVEVAPWVVDGRLLVEDPTGGLAWLRPAMAPRGASWVEGQLEALSEADGELRIVVDLGQATPRHDRLRIELEQPAAIPGLRLEASPEGQAWRTVAEGALMAAGDQGALRLSELSYLPTSDRFLRLSWPEDAPTPTWRTLQAHVVEEQPSQSLRLDPRPLLDTAVDGLGGDEGLGSWLLPVPWGSRPLRLELRWAGAGEATAVRVYRADRGHWELAAVSRAVDGAFVDPLDLDGARFLRVDLRQEGGRRPSLEQATMQTDARVLRWQAARAGRHRVLASLEAAARIEGISPAVDVAPGRATKAQGRANPSTHLVLPKAIRPRGAPAPDRPPIARWPIHVTQPVAPGTLVALALPSTAPDLLARRDASLRLLQEGAQLPFVIDPRRPPLRLAVDRHEPSPVEAETRGGRNGSGHSEIVVEIPAARRSQLQLELFSDEGPFERRGTISTVDPRAPIGAGDRRTLDRFTWRCPAPGLLRCTMATGLVVPPEGRGADPLVLTFEDGDDPPLSHVESWLWAADAALVFVMPEDSSGLSLAAYEPQLAPPGYDLMPLLERWSHVAKPIEGLSAEAADEASPGEVPPWLLVLVLLVATAALLWVLARTVRPPRPSAES